MAELFSQLTELGVFLLAVTGLLLGASWGFWLMARVFRLGCFHPSVNQEWSKTG